LAKMADAADAWTFQVKGGPLHKSVWQRDAVALAACLREDGVDVDDPAGSITESNSGVSTCMERVTPLLLCIQGSGACPIWEEGAKLLLGKGASLDLARAAEAPKFFGAADNDRSSMEAVVAETLEPLLGAPDKATDVNQVFRKFDANGDGSIDRAELTRILSGIGNGSWSDAQIDQLLSSVDFNMDGLIQYSEFVNWVFRDEEAQGMFDQLKKSTAEVPTQKSRRQEKRAADCMPEEDEQLYRPAKLQTGRLLVRKTGTFAYVHDAKSRFSEGVQGNWTRESEAPMLLKLEPESFGWLYQDRFEANEILELCPVVELSATVDDENILDCIFPENGELLKTWWNPGKEEYL